MLCATVKLYILKLPGHAHLQLTRLLPAFTVNLKVQLMEWTSEWLAECVLDSAL